MSMNRNRISTNGNGGFLVSFELPSEATLTQKLDEIFENTKIGKKVVDIVRGYFRNRLKYLRAKWYRKLNEMCIVLPIGQHDNMYILPPDKLVDFTKFAEDFRKELENYERVLIKFLTEGRVPDEIRENLVKKCGEEYVKELEQYLQLIKKFLEQHKVSLKIPSIASRFRYRLIPIVIDASFAYRLVHNVIARKHGEEVWSKVKDLVLQEIERMRKQWIEDAKRILEERLRELADELRNVKDKIKLINAVENELPKLESIARLLGLDPNTVDSYRTVKEIIEQYRQKIISIDVASERLRDILGI